MTQYLRVPRLYPEMEEATVGRWMIGVGSEVATGAPVVEIITDKVSYDVEAPAEAPGLLLAACAIEKSVLPVGSILAVLGVSGEAIPDWKSENESLSAARRTNAASARPVAAQPPSPASTPAGQSAPAGVVRATPSARRAAKAAGVSLEEVASSAAGATVTETDVERFVESRRGT